MNVIPGKFVKNNKRSPIDTVRNKAELLEKIPKNNNFKRRGTFIPDSRVTSVFNSFKMTIVIYLVSIQR